MAFYESIFIVRPDLTTEQVDQVVNRVADLITAGGGTILQNELWGRRQLAYPLKKNTKGYYVFNLVEGGGSLIADLEARLMIDEDILKFQNISVKKAHLSPSPLAPFAEKNTEARESSLLDEEEEYDLPDNFASDDDEEDL